MGWEEGLWIFGVGPCALLCAANHKAKRKTVELFEAFYFFFFLDWPSKTLVLPGITMIGLSAVAYILPASLV